LQKVNIEFQENINNEKNCRKQDAHGSSLFIGIVFK